MRSVKMQIIQIVTACMFDLFWTLTDKDCIVKPQTPRIGITVRQRIFTSWIRLPLSVSGSLPQIPEK